MQLHGTHIRKGGWSQGKDLSFYLKNVKKKSKLKPHRGSEDKDNKHGLKNQLKRDKSIKERQRQ